MKKTRKKPISDKILTVNNPRLYGKTELAFTSGGTKYYCFTQDSEVRYGRYIVLQAYLQEYNLRSSLEWLNECYDKIDNWLNPKEGARIEFGKVQELISIMKQRATIGFEPDTVYRLASCLFFDDTEVLSEYDPEYNKKKITRWKEDNTTDFFFHRLFEESTRLKITSKTDLENYLKQYPELLKGWNSAIGILSQ